MPKEYLQNPEDTAGRSDELSIADLIELADSGVFKSAFDEGTTSDSSQEVDPALEV